MDRGIDSTMSCVQMRPSMRRAIMLVTAHLGKVISMNIFVILINSQAEFEQFFDNAKASPFHGKVEQRLFFRRFGLKVRAS